MSNRRQLPGRVMAGVLPLPVTGGAIGALASQTPSVPLQLALVSIAVVLGVMGGILVYRATRKAVR